MRSFRRALLAFTLLLSAIAVLRLSFIYRDEARALTLWKKNVGLETDNKEFVKTQSLDFSRGDILIRWKQPPFRELLWTVNLPQNTVMAHQKRKLPLWEGAFKVN